jgi:SnoaL-like domain
MPDHDDLLKRLSDRLEIDELFTRYALGIDNRDWSLLDDVFTPDAEIDYSSSGAPKGRYPEIVAWMKEFLTPFAGNQHMTLNSQIILDGDVGSGRTYFLNPNAWPGDDGGQPHLLFVGGFYNDKFVRTSKGWRISQRVEESAWTYSDESLEVWAKRTGL